VCPACGSVTEGDRTFCSHCGEPIVALAPAVRASMRYLPPAPYVRRPLNRLAAASIVFAVVWLWGLGSVLAIISGHVARRAIDESHGEVGGAGIASTAIVLGWVGIALVPLVLVL
jgi:hypothetical protein